VAIVIIGGILLLSVLSLLGPAGGSGGAGASLGGAPAIAVIRVDGLIITGLGGTTGLLETASGSDSARKDRSVKAVVLRVNSPGGTPAAAQEISAEIQAVREAGKVVVTSMADVAASGAYWIAAVADHIVANPGTMTGSIGVIMEVANYQGLYEKLGIDYEVLVSGEHKDMGSPLRPITDDEREILLAMVQEMYGQFVDTVAAGRGMTRQQVLALADGRVFTGSQALEAGLVDGLGGLRTAVETAAELAGIEGSYRVEELGRPGLWQLLLGEVRSLVRALGRSLGGAAGGAVFGPQPELLLIGPRDFLDYPAAGVGGP